ncbi:MAG: phosphoribosylaminoimidazolesuccinocarboxamide synthase [Defluviitaleaceae bacterium]|nr:phosphoribosylaminoimidazolesuccinocarboxamide synthase [Defluviitaleaceae bacterium]
MKLICEGKTKNVYENENGTLTLKLKDDATGKDGIFDPGENQVGVSIKGLGRESLRLSVHYFEMIEASGIPTHFIKCDINAAAMDVKPAQLFGKGVEFICRRKATGSFVRRYGEYVKCGDDLDFIVEVTLKDDARKDPLITKDALVILKIMSPDEYETCAKFTRKIAQLIATDLQNKGLELYDLKLEFGKNNNEIILIDEVSAGCMRVYKHSKTIPPMDLGALILNTVPITGNMV